MRLLIILLAIVSIQCQQSSTKTEQKKSESTFGIVIHGGAGTILKNMTPEMEKEYRAVLAQAIEVGHAILKAGGTSQEAVEKQFG